MSNNIYDILKKMQNLEAPKQSLTEGKTSKPDYIDIDKDGDKKEPMKKAAKDKAKGGMAEAVARVEQQLSEKYTGFKKLGEETQQWQAIKQGAKDFGMGVADVAQGLATMATGGKVRSIDQQRADAQRREQKAIDRAAKEAGYEVGTRYHNQLVNTNPAYRDEYMSLAKDAPMGQLRNIQNQLQLKYDPMGGPMDESTVEESGLQAYLGKKKYGEQGMKALQQAGRDGASKEKMAKIRARHDKMDEGEYDKYSEIQPEHIKARPGSSDPRGTEEYQTGIYPDPDLERVGMGAYGPKAKIIPKIQGIAPEKRGEYMSYFNDDNMPHDSKHTKIFLPNPKKGDTYNDLLKNADHYTVFGPKTPSTLDKIKRAVGIDEDAYNEDMLSPKQKKIASMAGDPDKIDAKDFAALRGEKKGVKKEGNRFTAGLANDDIKVGEKIPGTNATKTKDIDEGGDGPEYQAAWKRTQDERKAWEKSNPDKKYYGQGPADRHSMELSKARDADTAAKDAKRSPLGRVANTLSRGLFGQDIDEGRTSMREGWEEMQKYLEKKRGPESKGDAGKKAGTRYGGSAQKDDDEDLDGEGKPAVKKKGRPKGTGGGAKFNFKKPKD